ncbi:MAG: hypothetical protein PVG45_03095 [Gammaproteobacteria bacterium]
MADLAVTVITLTLGIAARINMEVKSAAMLSSDRVLFIAQLPGT